MGLYLVPGLLSFIAVLRHGFGLEVMYDAATGQVACHLVGSFVGRR